MSDEQRLEILSIWETNSVSEIGLDFRNVTFNIF